MFYPSYRQVRRKGSVLNMDINIFQTGGNAFLKSNQFVRLVNSGPQHLWNMKVFKHSEAFKRYFKTAFSFHFFPEHPADCINFFFGCVADKSKGYMDILRIWSILLIPPQVHSCIPEIIFLKFRSASIFIPMKILFISRILIIVPFQFHAGSLQ